MSLPRSYQFIALRRLAVGGRQTRQLHMTGPATFPSPALIKAERPASNLPSDMAGLRAECKKRRLVSTGTKYDLMARLGADDVTSSRAFTTAVNASRRPTTNEAEQPDASVRHFNTSRVLKQPKDTSPIDFAYLPDFDPENPEANSDVPVLNFNFSERKTTLIEQTPEPPVMRAEISTMSANSTYSPMADVHDNNSMPIDFHAVADTFSTVTAKVKAPIVEQDGTIRQLWNGIVEDVLGPKKAVV